MNRGFRIAHAFLLSSFIVLVWTGFALKYPEGLVGDGRCSPGRTASACAAGCTAARRS